MIFTLVTVIITCVSLIALVLTKPSVTIKGHSISIYPLVPLLGAIVLLFSAVSPAEVGAGLVRDGAMNPLKILTLFISMTSLSVFLDEVGFFRYLAGIVLRKAKSSQFVLFVYLYIMVSVLTVFTSNDIIILTFTPFICYFARNADIDPLPYLFAEFVAANTWSMMLVIGNPTNIYLASAMGISFLEYTRVMALPTIIGGAVSFGMLLLLFVRRLKKPLSPVAEDLVKPNRPLLIIGLIHLGLCTIFLSISSYIHLDMWLITLAFAVSMFICVLIDCAVTHQSLRPLKQTVFRMPWELIPFVLSMFVLVMALDKVGITAQIAQLLGTRATALTYGASSFMVANLMNNIPMSVLYSAIIAAAPASSQLVATYAAIIGSNIAAFFTPIGALAGIMWSSILKKHEVKLSFVTLVLYGGCVAVVVLLASLGTLMLVFG